MNKQDLEKCVFEAIKTNHGKATIVQVSRFIWINYQAELECSGDLFFTWQYDMRWAANQLRRKGFIRATDTSPKGIWELA